MAAITSLSQLDLTKTYTYADYLTWQFDELVELIRGRVWNKSPAPRSAHQVYSWRLTLKIGNAVAGTTCQGFAAPFDVRLTKTHALTNRRVRTVVQPDLCVICDPAKVDEFGCVGAPDWIIEIVSPGSVAHDTKTKFGLYQENGVAEYWIVVPGVNTVTTYVLTNGRYEDAGEYYEPGPIPCATLPGLGLTWNDIFQPQ